MFDPILLVFHKHERVSAAGARLHFAEVEALVGACMCCWQWRAERKQRWGWKPLTCAMGAVGLPTGHPDTRCCNAFCLLAHGRGCNELCYESPWGDRLQRYKEGFFLAQVPLSRVRVKFRSEKTSKERTNLFQVTLFVA